MECDEKSNIWVFKWAVSRISSTFRYFGPCEVEKLYFLNILIQEKWSFSTSHSRRGMTKSARNTWYASFESSGIAFFRTMEVRQVWTSQYIFLWKTCGFWTPEYSSVFFLLLLVVTKIKTQKMKVVYSCSSPTSKASIWYSSNMMIFHIFGHIIKFIISPYASNNKEKKVFNRFRKDIVNIFSLFKGFLCSVKPKWL